MSEDVKVLGATAPSPTAGPSAGTAASGGFLLLDKPAGITSFQALRPVKRAFPKTKIGHAGTLDPAATGLLLVGVGSGTRLLEYLEGMPKTYSFIARFGMVSESYDMESQVTTATGHAAAIAAALDSTTVEKALAAFRGPIRQTPPDYSAIKIQGERACDRVRAGETVTLASREVVVHSLEILSFTPAVFGENTGATALMKMTCSKGTYVRSLVHDLGQTLGCGAVTDEIRRLAIGPFQVEAGRSPESLADGDPDRGSAYDLLLPLDTAVRHLPAAHLSESGVAAFLVGRAIGSEAYETKVPPDSTLESDQEFRALDVSGHLIAIATLNPQGLLCPKKVLVRN